MGKLLEGMHQHILFLRDGEQGSAQRNGGGARFGGVVHVVKRRGVVVGLGFFCEF
jgi:hypothetical protein